METVFGNMSLLVAQRPMQRELWDKEKSLCSKCGRLVTNKSYFSGSHLRGTCRPPWKSDREHFEWELQNRRPNRSDWRFQDPVERALSLPFGPMPEVSGYKKTKDHENDSNQLEFNL